MLQLLYKRCKRLYNFYFRYITGNPSSIHHSGREAKKIIENSRERIASFIKTEKNNIIFTSGATEANNISYKEF